MSAVTAPVAAAPEMTPSFDRTEVASLTLRTLLTSSAIFLVAGLLGGLLRQSQAGIHRLDPSTWYAIMTAHGLAAFVGWAGFALMGASWWVLEESGFPLRRPGLIFAEACYWTMVAGVAGVVITTLAMGVRRIVGVPLSAAVPRRGRVDGAHDRAVRVLGAARRALDPHLVHLDPGHGARRPSRMAAADRSAPASARRSASATSRRASRRPASPSPTP